MSRKGSRSKILRVSELEKEAARDQIEKLAQIGCTNEEIAYITDFEERELVHHFQYNLSKGRGLLRGNLRKAQIKNAIEDRNTSMLIWLGKQYLGQSEPRNQRDSESEIVIERQVYADSEEKAANS